MNTTNTAGGFDLDGNYIPFPTEAHVATMARLDSIVLPGFDANGREVRTARKGRKV